MKRDDGSKDGPTTSVARLNGMIARAAAAAGTAAVAALVSLLAFSSVGVVLHTAWAIIHNLTGYPPGFGDFRMYGTRGFFLGITTAWWLTLRAAAGPLAVYGVLYGLARLEDRARARREAEARDWGDD